MRKTWLAFLAALVLVCTGCQPTLSSFPESGESPYAESSSGDLNSSENHDEKDSSSENEWPFIFVEDPAMQETLPTEGQNFLDAEGFTFMPSEPSDLFVEEFQTDFYATKHYKEGREYKAFYNYVPEEIANKYHIYAFEVISPESVIGTVNDRSNYYLWYNGYIARVDSIGADADADKGFTHFALTDINGDGFFEFLASYTQKRSESAHFTYATVLDSRSKTSLSSSTIYRKYAYFKFDENGTLGLYKTTERGIENEGTLYTEFTENDARFQFAKKELFLQSDNYTVKVTVEKEKIHFPVQFNDADPYFTITTEMTYTGETFTYVNPDTYLAGALATLKDGENEVSMEGWDGGAAITTFTVKTGDVITRTYRYYHNNETPNQEGIYDMIISYRGEEILVTNFLKISKI